MMKMPKIELNKLSGDYSVRKLAKDDIGMIYDLCRKNEIFYRFHPPFVTKESIGEDMEALPPGRSREDKFYIGFFDGDKLIAVMDFIFGYPQENVVYIGFFMVESAVSGRGIGTSIIQGCLPYFASLGCHAARLAVDEGNPQSSAFWRKNGFAETGERFPQGKPVYLVMERRL